MGAAAMLPMMMGAQFAGSAISAIGQLEQGQSEANAAKYNAMVAYNNAQTEKQNATMAAQAGSAQAGMAGLRSRAEYGNIKASQAASGVDVNQGSAVNVRASERELGLMDAMTVRSNAIKEAWGYNVQASNDLAQQTLDKYEAKADVQASEFGAAGTLLGGAAQAGSQWMQYSQYSGLA